MKVIYFFRHPSVGFSIQRVFRTALNELEQSIEVRKIEVPRKGSMPWDLFINVVFTFSKRETNHINHVTGHIHDVLLGLIGVKTVLTIHDLVFLNNVKNPIKRLYKWLFWFYLPIRIADKVICISEHTKKQVSGKNKTDKLIVIHNAIDPIFKFNDKIFNEQLPIVLHIGTGWNKNLELTIKALEGISCHIRIIGKLTQNQLEILKKYNSNYSNVNNLTDEQIKKEYDNCDIVNFPSKYEGFGMPIIEGQKTGRIVVASNIEPLIEISGGAVVFINPSSEESIRNAYLKIIKNPIFRNNIIEKGLDNAERFSVKKISEQYLQLYKNL